MDFYDPIDYAEALDAKADLREDEYREALRDAQYQYDRKIEWMRRRPSGDLPISLSDFTRGMVDSDDRPF